MSLRSFGVVIPAHNEEELLPAALAAVAAAARHPGLAGARVLTVVVADACRDGTAEVAREAGALVVPTYWHNPGRARAAGTERALRELGTGGGTWIAATDADSVVPPHWLAGHARHAADGWDAVVGTVTVRTAAAALDLRHQAGYEATRPRDGSPWRHPHVHGANLGLTARAYLGVGGFPPLDVGEDRALVAALERGGHRVLRTSALPVLTSARLVGRATGGFADHLAALLPELPPAAPRESAG